MKTGGILLRKTFNINNKGSAAVEMAAVFIFVFLILGGFYHLFYIGRDKQKELILRQQEEVKNLRENELKVPILERPCQVENPIIRALCEGRKK